MIAGVPGAWSDVSEGGPIVGAVTQVAAPTIGPPSETSDQAPGTPAIMPQGHRLTTKELRWTSIFVRPPVSRLTLGRVLRKPGRACPGRWWGSRAVLVAHSATGHSLLLEIGPDIDASAWPVRLMSRSVTAVPGDHRRRPD